MAKHIVALDKNIGPPTYVEESPYMNVNGLSRGVVDPAFGSAMQAETDVSLYNVDVLKGIPEIPNSGMDESQMEACRRILTNKLAIIQGPPGMEKQWGILKASSTLIPRV